MFDFWYIKFTVSVTQSHYYSSNPEAHMVAKFPVLSSNVFKF